MATISICMIVKNEAAILTRCLDSLAGVAEEIIIVDTGSTDDTKTIAAQYTDKIYDFPWIEDFSAARNFAFSKCTQEYIYSVDADEVLTAEQKNKLLQLKRVLLPEVEIVQMYYVNGTKENSVYNFQKELRPKLFKRLREFRWIDPIHERILLQPVVYDSDIEILHLPEGEHTNRDLALLGKLVTEGKKLSDVLFAMYARELWKAGETEDFQKAKAYFSAVLSEAPLGEKRQMAQCILAKTALLEKDIHGFFKQAVNQLAEGITSEMCCLLGEYFYTQKEAAEGISWFQNAYLSAMPSMDIHCCGDRAFCGIAEGFTLLDNAEEAATWRQKAADWRPPEEV